MENVELVSKAVPSSLQKRGYKHTKLGWIPEEWVYDTLENISHRIMVGIASAATHAYRDAGIVLLRNLNITRSGIDDSNLLHIDEEYEKQHKNKRLRQGDVITVRTGYPGLSAVVTKELENSQCFTSLITRPNQKIVDSHFLCYFINCPKGKQLMLSSEAGGAQKNINAGVLSKLKIPLPPLPEQQKIAQILSNWDKAIDLTEQLIAKKQERKRGLMQQLLTGKKRFKEFVDNKWGKTEIQDIGTIIRGASPRPKGDPRYYNGSIPRLMVQDVTRDGKYVTPTIDFLTEKGAQLSRPCRAGTLTIVCSGEVGTPSFLAVDACIHDGFLAIIDLKKNVDKDYLYYQMLRLKSKIERSATHGGVFTNLTTTILKEFIIELPDLMEQQKIATTLTEIDQEILKQKQYLRLIKDQKKGLMQKLLTGAVRVKI